jgi:hypothetical protein
MTDDNREQQVEEGLVRYRKWLTTAVPSIIANDIAEGKGAGRLDEMMDELTGSQAKALLQVQVTEQALIMHEHLEQQQAQELEDVGGFAETS